MTRLLASTIALPLALLTNAGADTVVLSPSKDNTLYSDLSGNLSNGAGQYLFAGTNGLTQSQRALLSFALADSIPANATITRVSLTLNMSRTSSTTKTVALHRVLADWGEGTSIAVGGGGGEGNGAAPATGDATWIHTFFATSTWNAPGGDFSTETSATLAVNAAGVYTWESTPQLVADVQTWLDEPTSNFGWILIGDETGDRTSKRFDSRQNDNSTLRPSLTVEFTVITALVGDFDGDDNVGFQDFFLFADHFGTSEDSDNWDARFDLAPDGNVGFQDFFIFADNFGTSTN